MQAPFETLAWGYGLVEGPTVDAGGNLFFSDVVQGRVYRLDPAGGVQTVVPKRRGIGGLALHADGGLILSGRDIVHVRDGRTRVVFAIADLPGWNDLCTDRAGRIYAGALRFTVFDEHATPVPGECWCIAGPDLARVVYGDVIHANGIALSPDERLIAHADTRRQALLVHALDARGHASDRREIAVEGHPDGLAFDDAGCIWVAVAGAGCVHRYTPEGVLDRRIEVPARYPTSLCFAGTDRRDLIVVSADNLQVPDRRGSIFRLRVDVAGAPVHPARV
ncbi:MAG: SMP-30/gluconolactonase/LRE family protein [Gammaproteobacteria bacterium]